MKECFLIIFIWVINNVGTFFHNGGDKSIVAMSLFNMIMASFTIISFLVWLLWDKISEIFVGKNGKGLIKIS